jgi:hypothetical protein
VSEGIARIPEVEKVESEHETALEFVKNLFELEIEGTERQKEIIYV